MFLNMLFFKTQPSKSFKSIVALAAIDLGFWGNLPNPLDLALFLNF